MNSVPLQIMDVEWDFLFVACRWIDFSWTDAAAPPPRWNPPFPVVAVSLCWQQEYNLNYEMKRGWFICTHAISNLNTLSGADCLRTTLLTPKGAAEATEEGKTVSAAMLQLRGSENNCLILSFLSLSRFHCVERKLDGNMWQLIFPKYPLGNDLLSEHKQLSTVSMCPKNTGRAGGRAGDRTISILVKKSTWTNRYPSFPWIIWLEKFQYHMVLGCFCRYPKGTVL